VTSTSGGRTDITSSPAHVNSATPPSDSSLSPTAPIDKWDAFLDQATSSPQETRSNPTAPVITSVSQPPESSSESGPSSTGMNITLPQSLDLSDMLKQVTAFQMMGYAKDDR